MTNNAPIVIYQTADGQMQIDVRMENETVWLSANQMATLFDRDEKTIRKHINNVFSEGELLKDKRGCPKSLLSKEVSKKMILPCFFKQKNLVISKLNCILLKINQIWQE